MKTEILQSSLFKHWQKKRDLQKIEERLPDCFTMIANAMKSGLSFPQALEIIAQEIEGPLGAVFQEILSKIKMGESLEEVLLRVEKRLGLPDFSLMVHSIVILRKMGGNFVVHFEKLSQIIRERQKVSGKIRLLTTQGMTQGAILSLLPLGLGLALYFIAPEFLSPLWSHWSGWLCVSLVLLLDAGGYLWMRHMSQIKI